MGQSISDKKSQKMWLPDSHRAARLYATKGTHAYQHVAERYHGGSACRQSPLHALLRLMNCSRGHPQPTATTPCTRTGTNILVSACVQSVNKKNLQQPRATSRERRLRATRCRNHGRQALRLEVGHASPRIITAIWLWIPLQMVQ